MLLPALLTAMSMVALATPSALARPAQTATQSQQAPDLEAAAQQIVALTNAFRRDNGHDAAQTNAALTSSARYFAQYMARTDKYGHQADGSTPSERAAKHGYDYCIVAENIGYQFDSRGFTTDALAAAMVEGWKSSPTHRASMLDADVTETGAALARSEKTGRYYGVQMFGRPRTDAFSFQVTNRAGSDVRYRLDGREFTLVPRSTRTHEQCRAAQLELARPGTNPVRAQPTGGERYAVTRDGNGRIDLRVE